MRNAYLATAPAPTILMGARVNVDLVYCSRVELVLVSSASLRAQIILSAND